MFTVNINLGYFSLNRYYLFDTMLSFWPNLGNLGGDYYPFEAATPRPEGGYCMPPLKRYTQSIGRVTYLIHILRRREPGEKKG